MVVLDCLYLVFLHFVLFAFCHICILLHLYFVSFAFCYNCIMSYLHFVTFAIWPICILLHLHFVGLAFCLVCILSVFDVLLHLHFVKFAFCHGFISTQCGCDIKTTQSFLLFFSQEFFCKNFIEKLWKKCE